MTQTYRTDDFARWGAGQGFNLSPAQVDINFWDLVQRMIAQEARPDAAAGIDHFSISGTMMYVHMTDGTVLGPYELPVALYLDRGEWAPATAYAVMDTFTINGGLYVVTTAHTSDATFDPGANDGAGNDYYQLMLQTPGGSLPSGGAPGQLLVKATATDYEVLWGYTDASLVTYTPSTGSSLASTTVADALDEVVVGGATNAALVSYEPSTASGLTSDNVQDALDELGSSGGGGGGSVTPAALTRTDDTNVTLTLGGTPTTALLQATSITVGWSGTLGAARGGFGTDVSAQSGIPLFAAGTPTFTGTTGTGNFARAADPVFTGNPTAPTPSAGDSDTSIATTAFVAAAITTAAGIITQNSKSAAYTTLLTDAGKSIFHPSADTTARTWTIDSNANVAYTVGTAITFINQNAAGVITIAITSDTMRLAGAGTTGNRTLAANGVATAVKIAATEWIISGTGLT